MATWMGMPTAANLKIKCSKIAPFRQGYSIRLGVSGNGVCEVRMLVYYVHARGGHPGCSFATPTDRHLLAQFWRLGFELEENYSGHSFRIGTAIFTAAAGEVIQQRLRIVNTLQTLAHTSETVPARIVYNKVTQYKPCYYVLSLRHIWHWG